MSMRVMLRGMASRANSRGLDWIIHELGYVEKHSVERYD